MKPTVYEVKSGEEIQIRTERTGQTIKGPAVVVVLEEAAAVTATPSNTISKGSTKGVDLVNKVGVYEEFHYGKQKDGNRDFGVSKDSY